MGEFGENSYQESCSYTLLSYFRNDVIKLSSVFSLSIMKLVSNLIGASGFPSSWNKNRDRLEIHPPVFQGRPRPSTMH